MPYTVSLALVRYIVKMTIYYKGEDNEKYLVGTSAKGNCNCLIVNTGQFYVSEGNDF